MPSNTLVIGLLCIQSISAVRQEIAANHLQLNDLSQRTALASIIALASAFFDSHTFIIILGAHAVETLLWAILVAFVTSKDHRALEETAAMQLKLQVDINVTS